MNYDYMEIQELLQQRADLHARLKLLPYEGSPEIKERGETQYLYIRKRVGGKLTSTYVDKYSDDLYAALLRYAKEARELRRGIRHIDKRLAQLGYATEELSDKVILNIDFARANMKANIYDQAVLEGVATSFPQTEDIIENGRVNGVSANDVQKILNLKHAWEFVMDQDVIATRTDYYILCHIAKLVNEGFYAEGGRIRGVPVTIGGTSYVPPLPIELDVKEAIADIVNNDLDLFYYVNADVPEALAKLGRAALKAFNVRSRYVHFEFFRLDKAREGLGEVGDFVGLEVNMRPAGGYTPDMMDFAHSTDVYRIWADMVTADKRLLPESGDDHWCVYASRKDWHDYVHTHEEILAKYGPQIMMCERMPELMWATMGCQMYTAHAYSMDEVSEFINFIQERKA